MGDKELLLNSLVLELRRGTIILGVMSFLVEPQYGYSLVQALERIGLPVEPGTLYPLLRRLEKQGLLESSWDTSENRPRKYYKLSFTGREIFNRLKTEWQELSKIMAVLLDQGEE